MGGPVINKAITTSTVQRKVQHYYNFFFSFVIQMFYYCYLVFFSDQVRIAAAFYIGTEKKYEFPLIFFFLAVFTAMSMILSEIFARTRIRIISPAPRCNNNHPTNMVISNLIPFTKLNLIYAFDFVVNAIVKLFNPTQMGVPKLSLHGSMMLLLLVLSNPGARSHFKRKLATWRGVDLVQAVELQPQPNQQQSQAPNVHPPNKLYIETLAEIFK